MGIQDFEKYGVSGCRVRMIVNFFFLIFPFYFIFFILQCMMILQDCIYFFPCQFVRDIILIQFLFSLIHEALPEYRELYKEV